MRAFAFVCLFLVAPNLTASLSAAEITANDVQRSINGGVQYLRSTQSENGSWPAYQGQTGGLSSLCTLALLNCGLPADDPTIKKALRYLRGLTPDRTYSVSLQTLVFCQLGAASDIGAITRNVRWLESAQSNRGGWAYGTNSAGPDPSNTQFALLALGAAQDRGIRVDPAVFQKSQTYWLQSQKNDGGWSYQSGFSRGSMTCAGIASLIICEGRIGRGDAQIVDGRIICCGGASEESEPIEEGLAWLGNRFSVNTHPGASGTASLFYYLYAMERVGRMTGHRLIGGHDWYREGAEFLIGIQDPFQNRWRGNGFGETDPNITTSLALLFLSKGKRQVVVGRLQYVNQGAAQPPGDWQRHRGGLQQLVRHVERAWGRDLTWQTLRLEDASTADLLQTPVLIISGSEALQLSPDRSAVLKDYLDNGGCILFEANAGDGCGDAGPFERSVQKLCQEWFPSSRLEKLPPEHPVWSAEGRVQPSHLGNDFWLYGVQACCRTAVMYSPKSLACRWELSDPSEQRMATPAVIRKETAAAVQLGQNIIAYATGRDLKDKLDTRSILVTDFDAANQRGVLRIPKLAAATDSQEANRALPNLTTMLRDKFSVRVMPVETEVPLDAEALSAFPIVWFHGRTDFVWSDSDRQELRKYIDNGGVVLADSICGSEAFAKAFRREWKAAIPESPLESMPPDHPAMTAQFGYDLSNVTLRKPSAGAKGITISKRKTSPAIEFAMHKGLVAAYLSPYDLSCALESSNSIQCPGYDTTDAAKIGINLILYSMQQ